MVNPFDTSILHFVNQFAQRSWVFDKTVVFTSEDPFVGGGLATTFFWWCWFGKSQCPQKCKERATLLAGLAVSFAALFVARGLALSLPFRVRPYLIPDLHFRPPVGAYEFYPLLINWSAFPSDHAVLYFAMATCIFLVSWKVGSLAYLHAFFIICMPRLYLGEHYPTDIVVGALIGIGMGLLASTARLRALFSRLPLRFLDYSPAGFYTCFYVCTFLFATNFNSVRTISYYVWLISSHWLHHSQ